MSLLTQCPSCGHHFVRPLNAASPTMRCSYCHVVFTAAVDDAPASPPASLPLTAPIVISSVPPPMPTEFVIESEPVHEVEHIEVLDEPSTEPAPPSQAGKPAVGAFELGPPQTSAPPLDDVEVVEPPPRVPVRPPIAPEPVIDAEILPEPDPQPVHQAPVPLDHVEVIDDPAPVPTRPAQPAPPGTVPVFTEVEPPAPPSPPPLRRKERPLDIRRRVPDKEAGVPWRVWLGLGIPLLAIVVLVVIILIVMRSGASSPNPQAQQAPQPAALPAAPAADQFLPRPEDRPTPPDRRGPAPWLPKPSPLNLQPRAADQLQGLVGYWPLDEGKDAQVADASTNKHQSTLVGGWWIDGVRGKALLFDGQRDYLELGTSPALNFRDNAPFTVAGWMATEQQNGYLLAFRNPKNLAPVVQVKVSGGALCGVVRADGSEFGEARVGLAPVADGRWHHFAVMRHPGGVIETFLDGRSLDKRQGANTIGPITTMVRAVGCARSWYLSQQTAAAYFSCAVDELCVFDRALTTQEIGQLVGKK